MNNPLFNMSMFCFFCFFTFYVMIVPHEKPTRAVAGSCSVTDERPQVVASGIAPAEDLNETLQRVS